MQKPSARLLARLAQPLSRAAVATVLLASTAVQPVHAAAPTESTATSLAGNYLSARTALYDQDYNSAALFFENALRYDPQNFYLQDRAFTMALASGHTDQAIALSKDLLQGDPEHFLGSLLTTSENLRAKNYASVLEGEGTTSSNPLARLTFTLAEAWANAGKGDKTTAIKLLEDLNGPSWYKLFTLYNAGLIEELSGHPAAAAKEFSKAYKADPGSLRALLALSRNLTASGQQKQALEKLAAYEEVVPAHPLAVQMRDQITAGAVLEPTITSPAEGMADALFSLGSAINRDGEELSAAYLHLSSYLNPKLDETIIALADLYEQLGDYARSIEFLQQVSMASPLKHETEILIATHYNALDKLEQAKDHLSTLIKANPKDVDAHTTLGNILRSRAKFNEAEAAYTRALDIKAEEGKDDWVLHYFRGISREQQKNWPKAEEDLRAALKLNPKQPMVLNYLGYSLVDRGMSFDEALDMIKTAVSLRPTDGYIVDSLGWVYYRLGRFDEAVKELERAVSLRPHDPLINEHLGDAYWQVGRKLDARFKWNHARDLDPEPQDLTRILGKIERGLQPESSQVKQAKQEMPEDS
ncbi:tetratricopeptide repeat protein [Polycladidibacter hongkongensis]|uniref:tetratricopeptide repeat protein n=1 Tax=Polycladidibacter hongkongensis TaxID=1647556 RepID=UPI0008358E0C|nr:tetratricopeptide repeat protein [Pseudovibrio hongkongensis]